MAKKPDEQSSLLEIQSPTKAKLERWAELKTDELETLYTSMEKQLSSISSDEWNDWARESFKVIGDIVSKRRADAVRQEIARMMDLAGMSYGIERAIHQRKAAALKRLNKNNR